MPDFAIVDSHVHLTDPARFTYSWMDGVPKLKRQVLPADVMRAAQPVAIESFVFVEVDIDLPQQVAEAKWVNSLAASQPPTVPKLKGMVASLPLEHGRAVEAELNDLLELKTLRSIRRLIQNQPTDFCTRPDFIAGLKLLASRDLAFDICIFHHQLQGAIKMVQACPEVRFVLDHIGKPAIKAGILDPWRADLKALASQPNVFCKISGVINEADHRSWTREQLKPYIAHTIDTFGFDRVMFGGDWHVLDLAAAYPQWVEVVDWVIAGASRDEKRKLFRDTAIDFYRLDR